MAQLSLSRAWDETRAIFARDGGLLIAVALAMLVLPETVVGLMTPGGSSMTVVGRCVWLVGALIGIVGQIALVRLALGPSTTVGHAIGHGARRFLPTLGSLLILFACLAIIVMPLMIVLMLAGVVTVPVAGQQTPPSFTFVAIFLLAAAQFVGGIVAQLIAGKIAPFSLGALILALLLALASASATTLFAV